MTETFTGCPYSDRYIHVLRPRTEAAWTHLLEDRDAAHADYVRQLEDACLILWAELPNAEVKYLRTEVPRLIDFLGHLHRSVEHEQAMVRQNVWDEGDKGPVDGGNGG